MYNVDIGGIVNKKTIKGYCSAAIFDPKLCPANTCTIYIQLPYDKDHYVPFTGRSKSSYRRITTT
jgi:hypothetical protein